MPPPQKKKKWKKQGGNERSNTSLFSWCYDDYDNSTHDNFEECGSILIDHVIFNLVSHLWNLSFAVLGLNDKNEKSLVLSSQDGLHFKYSNVFLWCSRAWNAIWRLLLKMESKFRLLNYFQSFIKLKIKSLGKYLLYISF